MTRQQLASTLDVSMVTVQKWLSAGGMKDSTAQVLASHVLCDWLWLRHGISRIPEEMEGNITKALSDALVITFSHDKWLVDQMGEELRAMFMRMCDDDIIELDTEQLCLPQYWGEWSDWAECSFLALAQADGGAPVYDCSGALLNKSGEIISGSCKTKLVTLWTDRSGITKGVIAKV